MKRTIRNIVLCLASMTVLAACNQNDAVVVSKNMNTSAENFEINRRIVFYNGITDKYMLGLSDNTTFIVEQFEPVKASAYHYRVTFKPQTILPDIDFRGSTQALGEAVTPDNKD